MRDAAANKILLKLAPPRSHAAQVRPALNPLLLAPSVSLVEDEAMRCRGIVEKVFEEDGG